MEEKIEKKGEEITQPKPVTHVAVPIENLKELFDYLKTLDGISFSKGNEIIDIVRKNNINVSMASGNPDDVLNPPPGEQ